MSAARQPYLDRARRVSALTIPSLVPPEGHTPTSSLEEPYESMGSRCVNHFAARLMLTLFPPGSKNFRLVLSPDVRKAAQDAGQTGSVEAALTQIEDLVHGAVEASAHRPKMYYLLRLLIVSGNAVIYWPKDKTPKVFPLYQFVVERDGEGTPIRIITKEHVHPETLPESVRGLVKASAPRPDESVTVWTMVERQGQRWVTSQEVNGFAIPEGEGTFALDVCPWNVVGWTYIDGEPYARSMAEDYIGDLRAAEGLSKAILEGSLAAAKVLFLVRPGGSTKKKDLLLPNLSVVDGLADDVTVAQMSKGYDFAVAKSTLDEVQTRLAYAFLLNSAIQRNGERVTAEEIRYMAGELENTHGGIYALLSTELQMWIVSLFLSRLKAAGVLPDLPKDDIAPTIITGVDALGRTQELQRLNAFIAVARETLGDQVLTYINTSEYLSRLASAAGVAPNGLVATPEEVQAREQQAQQAEIARAATGPVINAVSRAATQSPQEQPTQ